MGPRVVLDTNLYLSYLLRPASDTAVTRTLEAALGGDFQLLLPVGVVDEILRKTATSQYLKERIDLADASALLQAVGELAELIDLASVAIPSIVRDANDDFLIAAALEGNADFLVTGDADLLALSGVIQKLHIVRPGEFLLQLTEW